MGAYESGVAGDVDCDGTLDLIDFESWAGCMTGPGAKAPIDPACYPFDVAPDARIDLKDFAAFSQLLTVP